MTLAPGAKLGPYEILAPIGAGGMGEVYRARDPRVGRDVAIKMSSEQFTDRFTREIHAVAALNHSNVCTLYDVGPNYLVMEFIEGPTLADRIKQGAIPLEESLQIARQIADALEAAHEKGIVHRDLKPGNIKIRPDGTVKVLDFGLAKMEETKAVSLETSPTLSAVQTAAGVILGTAAYMSPEQARGRTVDKRADVWAFGCVLYEMLTGQPAFQGEDVSEILASVIKGGANLDLLPANINPRVREVLNRCLQKDMKRRYQDIGDARYEIEQVLTNPTAILVQPVTTVETRTRLRLVLAWVAAAIVLTAIIVGVAVWNLKPAPPSEPRQVMRFDYEVPEIQQLSSLNYPVLAVSPDGKQFVYSTSKGLYMRSVDELTSKLIPGTEGSTQQPFFSPDGKSIAYFSVGDRQLKKIAINGGVPVALCSVAQLAGASWGTDNTIVYGQLAGNIMRISAEGGTPESLIKETSGITLFPQILPDGKSMLYTVLTSFMQTTIMLQPLKSGEPKELFRGGMARYLPTGHIVYAPMGNNNLFAVPFDLGRLKVTGEGVPIVEGVLKIGSSWLTLPQYAISESGTLIYIPGANETSGRRCTMVWMDRNGKEEPITAAPDFYFSPRISPDGARVALTVGTGESNIQIWDLARKTLTQLTFDKGQDHYPLWTPDGKRIVFASDHEGKAGLYGKAANGTGGIEKLISTASSMAIPSSWSGGGKVLVYEEVLAEKGGSDVFALSMEGERVRKPLLQERYVEGHPQISPDGRWMAYASSETGQMEVFVCPFPDVSGGKWRISTSGGSQPRWSPDGREMLYRNRDAMMAVAIETEPAFRAGSQKELFRKTYVSELGHMWDLSPDGKRFLMLKPVASAEASGAPRRKINIVLNWLEELKQRVPGK